MVVDCIIIPASWIFSTRKSFPELRSEICLERHDLNVPESVKETRNENNSVKNHKGPYVDDRDLKEILEHDAMKLSSFKNNMCNAGSRSWMQSLEFLIHAFDVMNHYLES